VTAWQFILAALIAAPFIIAFVYDDDVWKYQRVRGSIVATFPTTASCACRRMTIT
jgi:hypothetical protein